MHHAARGWVILGVFAAGCVSRGRYVALERTHEQLEHRYVALRDASDGVRLRLAELEAEIAAMEEEEIRAPSFFGDLLDEFRPLLADDLEVVVYPDRTVLAFDEGLTFPSGSARLDEAGTATLRALADLIRQHPERQFLVEGHTDRVPISTWEYRDNWELGAARAVAVIEALVEAGADPDQLAAATWSSTDPLHDEPGRQGLRENRRVQITVVPTLDEIPGQERLLDAVRTFRATEAEGEDEREEERAPPARLPPTS